MLGAMGSNIRNIYVPLLDEGTDVTRPTRGVSIRGELYKVLATENYAPEDEHWAFPPGSIVRCVLKELDGEISLVACKLVEE